ncbi:hypothetical protein EXS56_01580 [Candidatus Kaiserbacteria bacterium]|nr:hypothetical protein [Candidatus Kaiserbacteria bacterium]
MNKRILAALTAAFFVGLPLTAHAQAGTGAGCPRLMNVKACADCVARDRPGEYSLSGREAFCQQVIAQRKAKGKGKETLRYKVN